MRKELRLLAVVISVSLLAIARLSAFSAKNIISPIPGTWANMQALVIDVSDGSDVYYSLTSSDPLASGFAYDGPVLIDASGAVTLYVSAVSSTGVRSDYTVSYTVAYATSSTNSANAALFIKALTDNPIRRYVSGTLLSIPSELKYGMDNTEPVLAGKSFTVSILNKLERYIPCSVTDGKSYWRFIIHTVAASSDPVNERTVPFALTNWTTFTYTGQKLIYQIDDGYWSADRKSVTIDRSVPHVIRWQSVEYQFGNPVQEYLLPAKPELVVAKNDAGVILLSIPADDGFQLGAGIKKTPAGQIAQGLYSTIGIDTFDGDEVRGPLDVSVYYQNVFQGTLPVPVDIDKQPPENPQIVSSSKVKYARNVVTLTITSQGSSKIFYAVSAPIESDTGFENVPPDKFDSVPIGTYTEYDGNPVVLKSTSDSAAFYKVNSYAVDEAGNTSGVSEYRIVVDEYNYYLSVSGKKFNNDTSVDSEPDGSYGNPFTTFAQALKVINSLKYTRLHVSGSIEIESGDYVISSSCKIVGNNNHIVFSQDAVITVQGGSFEAENCIFEKQVKAGADKKYLTDEQTKVLQRMFIVGTGSKVHFTGCELVGVFSSDGVLVDVNDASITFTNCGLTVQADNYACALSQEKTASEVQKTRITSIAATCVCLSVHKGSVAVSDSTCHVIGKLGRIAELVQTKATVSGCLLNGSFETKSNGLTAIWKDVDSSLVQKDNSETGF